MRLAARRLLDSAPEPVKSAARRVRRRVAGDAPVTGPILTVVVPAYNVQDYVGECLESLLGQSLRELEVIVVDDGSTDATWTIVREFADSDSRVTAVQQTNSGQGIARNHGVELARGEFLTFVDADDTVPPKAFEHMVRGLEKSGSDFSIGSARRFSNGRFHRTVWATTVHQRDRIGVTIESFPLAMQDIIACNRMFRTSFWREHVGGFRGHIAYEDHVPMLKAYVRARQFDVLTRTTYNWRIREDLTSTSQQKASVENLLDRVAVKQEAYQLLVEEASEATYDAWISRTLEVDFPAFIPHATPDADLYRAILAAVFRTFLSRATPAALADVRYYQKCRGWLIAHDRWDDLETITEYFARATQLPPTTVEDGRVLAEEVPCLTGFPPELRELSDLETRFDGAIESARWNDDGLLVVTGWGFIRGLDMPEPAKLGAWLDAVDGDQPRHLLEVEAVPTPAATIWGGNTNARYDGGGFRLAIDPRSLGQGRWRLGLSVEHHGLQRTGSLHGYASGGSGVRSVGAVSELNGDYVLSTPRRDREHGFCLEVTIAGATLVSGTCADAGHASGTLRTRDGVRPLEVSVFCGEHRADVELVATQDGHTSFEVDLTTSPAAGLDWTVKADLGDGARSVVFALPHVGRNAESALRWRSSQAGTARLSSAPVRPMVSGLRVDDEDLVVRVDPGNTTQAELRTVVLTSPTVSVSLTRFEDLPDGTVELYYPLRASVLGGPELALPRGAYKLALPGSAGDDERQLSVGPRLTQTLPLDLHTAETRLRVVSPPPQSGLTIHVAIPLRAEERSPAGQRILQEAHRSRVREPSPRESVLFQCYRGEFATDSQRPLDEALAAARPDLTRYWGVADYSVQVPPGSVPVLFKSQEWFDVLASARYLCNNIDFDGFFEKRPHQRYLQTFHGYPFKSMGRGFWQSKNYSPSRIEREIARRNAEYDAILVPSAAAADFYRSEYDYTGRSLVTGYPRSDFPVTADQAEVRALVGKRLQIPSDKTLILYAPTYRDDLTTRTYAAKLFGGLDLSLLTRRLGEDVVILLRGHNNNQREKDRVLDVPGVVDVTDYPEINHLTVAADAAILDYSSLRFDWALTGKPMVFFVPDLDSYFAKRPPLFGFHESAPGPLLSTTEEVAGSLADLADLAARTAPEIARFNATYNQLHDGHATDRVVAEFFTD